MRLTKYQEDIATPACEKANKARKEAKQNDYSQPSLSRYSARTHTSAETHRTQSGIQANLVSGSTAVSNAGISTPADSEFRTSLERLIGAMPLSSGKKGAVRRDSKFTAVALVAPSPENMSSNTNYHGGIISDQNLEFSSNVHDNIAESAISDPNIYNDTIPKVPESNGHLDIHSVALLFNPCDEFMRFDFDNYESYKEMLYSPIHPASQVASSATNQAGATANSLANSAIAPVFSFETLPPREDNNSPSRPVLSDNDTGVYLGNKSAPRDVVPSTPQETQNGSDDSDMTSTPPTSPATNKSSSSQSSMNTALKPGDPGKSYSPPSSDDTLFEELLTPVIDLTRAQVTIVAVHPRKRKAEVKVGGTGKTLQEQRRLNLKVSRQFCRQQPINRGVASSNRPGPFTQPGPRPVINPGNFGCAGMAYESSYTKHAPLFDNRVGSFSEMPRDSSQVLNQSTNGFAQWVEVYGPWPNCYSNGFQQPPQAYVTVPNSHWNNLQQSLQHHPVMSNPYPNNVVQPFQSAGSSWNHPNSIPPPNQAATPIPNTYTKNMQHFQQPTQLPTEAIHFFEGGNVASNIDSNQQGFSAQMGRLMNPSACANRQQFPTQLALLPNIAPGFKNDCLTLDLNSIPHIPGTECQHRFESCNFNPVPNYSSKPPSHIPFHLFAQGKEFGEKFGQLRAEFGLNSWRRSHMFRLFDPTELEWLREHAEASLTIHQNKTAPLSFAQTALALCRDFCWTLTLNTMERLNEVILKLQGDSRCYRSGSIKPKPNFYDSGPKRWITVYLEIFPASGEHTYSFDRSDRWKYSDMNPHYKEVIQNYYRQRGMAPYI